MKLLLWLMNLITRLAPPTTRLAQRAERKTQDVPGEALLRDILGRWGMEMQPAMFDPNGDKLREVNVMGAMHQTLLSGGVATLIESIDCRNCRLRLWLEDACVAIDIHDWRMVQRLRDAIREFDVIGQHLQGVL